MLKRNLKCCAHQDCGCDLIQINMENIPVNHDPGVAAVANYHLCRSKRPPVKNKAKKKAKKATKKKVTKKIKRKPATKGRAKKKPRK